MLIPIELCYLAFGKSEYYTKNKLKELIDYFVKQFRFAEN